MCSRFEHLQNCFNHEVARQAGALVQVYTYGTVLVTHGGVEMGQGLHTKLAQIAAFCFNIPLNFVFISTTGTDKVPNSGQGPPTWQRGIGCQPMQASLRVIRGSTQWN